MRMRHAIGLVAALAVMGCANMGIPGMSRTNQASQETLITATATVAAIDQSSRQVTLVDDVDGSTFTVTAGPEVRNLGEVQAGDRVQLDYYRAVAVELADPADSGEAITADLGARSAEGSRPGALAATSTSMVVTLITYDRSTGLATFRTPDGLTRRAIVPPNLRTFAETRGPGARVLLTMTEALAVSVTEMPAS